jgi:hypothetical protein
VQSPLGIIGRIEDIAVVSNRYVAVGTAPGARVGDTTFWDGAVWIYTSG